MDEQVARTIVTLWDRLWAVEPTIRYVKAQAAAKRVLDEQKPVYDAAKAIIKVHERLRATWECDDCHRSDGTHDPDVEH